MTSITTSTGVWRQRVATALRRAIGRRAGEAWQPLDEGWRVAATDQFEVRLVRVADIGWQVELRDAQAGQALGRPTFSQRLDDATRIARFLRAHYAPRAAREGRWLFSLRGLGTRS